MKISMVYICNIVTFYGLSDNSHIYILMKICSDLNVNRSNVKVKNFCENQCLLHKFCHLHSYGLNFTYSGMLIGKERLAFLKESSFVM